MVLKEKKDRGRELALTAPVVNYLFRTAVNLTD